ncbi:MAG: DUF1801 domain-containing protein [Phycisphaerales bacterium]
MKSKPRKPPTRTGRAPATPNPAAGTAGAGGWRESLVDRVRAVILKVDAGVIEERKWPKASNGMRGIPVWSHPACGIICTGETYKDKVKLTFAKGAALKDPAKLFNSGLEGGTRRAIDIPEGGAVNARALQALVKAAIVAGKSPRK